MPLARLLAAALAVVWALGLATAVELPQDCLWVEEGTVKVRGPRLQAPPELLRAEHLSLLTPVGKGLLLWAVEQRDETGELTEFRLSLADLKRGRNLELINRTDPFGEGSGWLLQRAQLAEGGKVVLLKIRLTGSGGFSVVYRLRLENPA